MSGQFFMVEGIDGSGKTAAVNAIKEWAVSKNLKILDLQDYCEQKGRFPQSDEIADFDILFTDEPSYSFVGKAIREELIVEGKKYAPLTLANAFALDREILYRRVIIPALKLKKLVVAERGFASTMVYQPVQEKLPLGDVMRLPGNQLAISHPPDVLLILSVSADAAISRINSRFGASFSMFDNLFFQRKIEERYTSVWLRGFFEKLGTKVVCFSTNAPSSIDANRSFALKLFLDMANSQIKQKDTQTQLSGI